MRKKIGELAIDYGWINGSERNQLLEIQKQMRLRGEKEEKSRFGIIMVEHGGCTFAQLEKLLQNQQENEIAGRYHLLEEIGKGGMGVVYKAFDKTLAREVALKLLKTKVLETDEGLQRFQKEAQTIASLSHPFLVTIHDFGMYKGRPYLVSELIKGETLKDFARKNVGNYRKIIQIIMQIGEALQYIHNHNIIHRDIKPSNIMITQHQHPKLIDFGLAINQGPVKEYTFTKQSIEDLAVTKHECSTTKVIGTPAYMAPEQVNGQEIDRRSDIYSLGITLYQSLSGVLPFQTQNAGMLPHQILHQKPRSLLEINSKIPVALQAICEKAIKADPNNRYSSLEPMLEECQKVLHQNVLRKANKHPSKVFFKMLGFCIVICLIYIFSVFIGKMREHKNLNTRIFPKKITLKKDTTKDLSGKFIFLYTKIYRLAGIQHRVKVYKHRKTDMEFVLVPGGKFIMGRTKKIEKKYISWRNQDELPSRTVCVTPFLISRYEVTYKVWKRAGGGVFLHKRRGPYRKNASNYPIVAVTFYEARDFAQKLGLQLPSEAQWEYACRAGTNDFHYWGKENGLDFLWCKENTWAKNIHHALPVGQKKPNALGLFDMLGNISEWCQDTYQDTYKNAPLTCKAWIVTKNKAKRVVRGGCYVDMLRDCYSYTRKSYPAKYYSYRIGFRLVYSVK